VRPHHHAPRPRCPRTRRGAPARLGPRMHPSAHPAADLLCVRRTLAPRVPRRWLSALAPGRRFPRAEHPTSPAELPAQKHPRDRAHRIPRPASTACHSDMVPGSRHHPCNHATCNAAHRPQGNSSPTDKGVFFLVTGVPSRSSSTPPPGHASNSELVCGTSCHRRCSTLLLYSRFRLSNYISDLWS
jgi:hypothetical protein